MSYKKLPDETRVWIYQSSRILRPEEVKSIKWEGTKFAMNWLAHSQPLKAAFEVFHDYFLVLFVDETKTQTSGCSIDESVDFIRSCEQKYEISLLDRSLIAFRAGEGIATCTREQFLTKIEKGFVNVSTVVFDNTITTKGGLETKWQVPLKDSWLFELLEK